MTPIFDDVVFYSARLERQERQPHGVLVPCLWWMGVVVTRPPGEDSALSERQER